jgi:hypothetical protein
MDRRVKFTAGPATSGRTRLPGGDEWGPLAAAKPNIRAGGAPTSVMKRPRNVHWLNCEPHTMKVLGASPSMVRPYASVLVSKQMSPCRFAACRSREMR